MSNIGGGGLCPPNLNIGGAGAPPAPPAPTPLPIAPLLPYYITVFLSNNQPEMHCSDHTDASE